MDYDSGTNSFSYNSAPSLPTITGAVARYARIGSNHFLCITNTGRAQVLNIPDDGSSITSVNGEVNILSGFGGITGVSTNYDITVREGGHTALWAISDTLTFDGFLFSISINTSTYALSREDDLEFNTTQGVDPVVAMVSEENDLAMVAYDGPGNDPYTTMVRVGKDADYQSNRMIQLNLDSDPDDTTSRHVMTPSGTEVYTTFAQGDGADMTSWSASAPASSDFDFSGKENFVLSFWAGRNSVDSDILLIGTVANPVISVQQLSTGAIKVTAFTDNSNYLEMTQTVSLGADVNKFLIALVDIDFGSYNGMRLRAMTNDLSYSAVTYNEVGTFTGVPAGDQPITVGQSRATEGSGRLAQVVLYKDRPFFYHEISGIYNNDSILSIPA